MHDRPGQGLRVLYALSRYPHIAHTYMMTEIETMRRFGVHVEVWSSAPPLAPFDTDVQLHNGSLADAIESVKPHLVHVHWTHWVAQFRNDVAQAGLPLTARGHHPHDYSPKIADALQSDSVVRSVYMFRHFAEKLSAKYTKVIPVDACFDPELYYPDHDKDPRLVIRASPARKVKELELFIRVAARCPNHRFVLAACSTNETTYPDQLKQLNQALGGAVEILIDVSHQTVSALMRKAGTYLYTVLPSEEYSMPISVSEAIGAGCYVLSRASDNARLHLGTSGALYENEDEAVRLLTESLDWNQEQWAQVKADALARAEELASPRGLRPILDDWLRIARMHSGFISGNQQNDVSVRMEITEKKRLIVVLGCHRSGTSVIARSLQTMGVDLGDTLIAPIQGINDKGFWEDAEISAFNEQILQAVGTSWNGLKPIQQTELEILTRKGYLIEAVSLLRQKTENKTIFGFKDPRISRLLPFWQKVISQCQLDVSYVIAIRHPLSVVQSLAKRDGIDAKHGYLLWLEYTIQSFSGTAGCSRVLVDYDHLLESPAYQVDRIAKALDLKINQSEHQIYQNEFLDETLRHKTFSLKDLITDEACPRFVREIYKLLSEVASDKISIASPELHNQISSWSETLEHFDVSLTLVDSLLSEKASILRSLATCDAALEKSNQKLIELYSSRSWQITEPFRLIKGLINRCYIAFRGL